MRSIKTLICLMLVSLVMPVQAALDIRITEGIEGAIPIAINDFEWVGAGAPPIQIDQIVTADLKRSGRFSPMDRGAMPQPGATPSNIELYRWREKNINYVVVGRLSENSAGQYEVLFKLIDPAGGQQLAGYTIPTGTDELRMAAHQVSDLIYEAILGVKGAFNTRIAYITSRGRGADRRHIIEVADSDGHGSRTILNSGSPLMSPSWAPDNRRIAYVSFENNRSSIYVQDVATGQREKVSSKSGINGAPVWSPDGSRIALTLSESGSPDIYVLNVSSRSFSRVTNDRSINTEPAWTPDGQSIIFTSNRSGKPQLYEVSVSGGKARRITFEGEYNSAASVSPDGSKIALVNGNGRGFRIAVMDRASGDITPLTAGTLDESPSFAPNGSMIIYATESGGRGVLAAVSDDGRVKQTLVLQEGEVREPDWSSFLN